MEFKNKIFHVDIFTAFELIYDRVSIHEMSFS